MKQAKRFIAAVMVAAMVFCTFSGCSKKDEDYTWKPGTDSVTLKSETASAYTPTFTVFLKVVGGDKKVLFDGQVTLTSDTMWASEFLKAAITDKGLAQDGIDVGFVTKLGDYENNATDSIYWMFTVNGVTPAWGCNQLQLRDGDYMLWTYDVVTF
jgi:hypothetical protein